MVIRQIALYTIYTDRYVLASGGGEPEEVYVEPRIYIYIYIWPKCKNQKPLVYYRYLYTYVCKKVLV